MSDAENIDSYEPEHPELIPGNRIEAHLWVSAATVAGLNKCPKAVFLKGWWAFCWLNPGFHPDDFRQWDNPDGQKFATEALRRYEIGEIEHDLVYPTEAAQRAESGSNSPVPAAFTDDYLPQHPEFIPADEAEAKSRLEAAPIHDLAQCPREIFLKAWWALFWISPNKSPDYYDEWESDDMMKLAQEAFRRFNIGEIDYLEMFPCEACHARVVADRKAGVPAHQTPDAYDRLVVIRTDDGQYISRAGGATPNRNEAARYYMIDDRVADQLATVKKLYGRTMTTEDGR